MKNKIKQLSAVVMVLLAILVATAGKNPDPKKKKSEAPKFKVVNLDAKGGEEECLQCGVTNAQIQTYLETCSHHHTVYWIQDIPGTCNSRAGIENCDNATVYVSGGAIIGHTDAGLSCGGGGGGEN